MLILEEFTDTWNYTFIIVAIIAIGIGTFITLKKMPKEETKKSKKKKIDWYQSF